ncbi:MAG: hypothetical protein ACRD0P_36065, partial [Stackebrandtia sp.]
ARTHPDPGVYARMAAVARSHPARRFALCRYVEARGNTAPSVFREYLGWQYRDGVTVTDHHGHPVGWYTTIDSAHHHLTEKRSTSLWLVWLESDRLTAPEAVHDAATEATREEPDMFIAMIPFMAAGANDARLHAIRLMQNAATFLPEVQRQLVQVGSSTHGVRSLFCSQFGCVKPPHHPGDHDIPPFDSPRHDPPKSGPGDLDITTAEAENIANARAKAEHEAAPIQTEAGEAP